MWTDTVRAQFFTMPCWPFYVPLVNRYSYSSRSRASETISPQYQGVRIGFRLCLNCNCPLILGPTVYAGLQKSTVLFTVCPLWCSNGHGWAHISCTHQQCTRWETVWYQIGYNINRDVFDTVDTVLWSMSTGHILFTVSNRSLSHKQWLMSTGRF